MQKIGIRTPCVYREKSATTGKLVEAMAKANAEFLPLQFDQTGVGHDADGREYEYRYASLAAINKATKVALSKHGLWLHCDYGFDERGVFACVVLEHKDGEFVSSTLPVPNYGSIHQQKAAMTLMRRAAIEGLLGLSAEEDTDAQCCSDTTAQADASPPANPIWEGNEQMAIAAIEEARDPDRLREILGKVSLKVDRGTMRPESMKELERLVEARMNVIESAAEAVS